MTKPKTGIQFNSIQFVKSASSKKEYPKLNGDSGRPLAEIALVGRSNVGKSSLLNDLFEVKNIAKTSQTPGKTQLINFFKIENALSIVDLPGYGYAKVARTQKEEWGQNIQEYLETRKELTLIIQLLDIRHAPTRDDIAFFEWARFHNKRLLIVFTKTDKVKLSEKLENAKKILSQLPDNAIEWVYYSAKTHEGRVEMQHILLKVMNGTY
jgi:GTP-binding protein